MLSARQIHKTTHKAKGCNYQAISGRYDIFLDGFCCEICRTADFVIQTFRRNRAINLTQPVHRVIQS